MNLPQEFCERMKELTKDEFDDFIASYDTQLNRGIRVNTLKCDSVQEIAGALGVNERVEWCSTGFYADNELSGNHPYHAAGVFYFQEPSAQSVAEFLPIKKGDRILDLCAAPGGKTTHIGARMENCGIIYVQVLCELRSMIPAEMTY